MSRSKNLVCVSLIAIFLASCSGREPATPTETFKTYTKAIKAKDTATMKLLLTDDTVRMHEEQAKAQGMTAEEIINRESLIAENQKTVKFRNEKIDGDRATLEVESSFGSWQTIVFKRENGEWKIDKKGIADQLLLENEADQKELERTINEARPATEP